MFFITTIFKITLHTHVYNASISFPTSPHNPFSYLHMHFELGCMIFFFFLSFSTFKENKRRKKNKVVVQKKENTHALVELVTSGECTWEWLISQCQNTILSEW